MKNKPVIAYTDGAAFNNPGPGGWACVLMHGSHRREISKGYYRTTNNRMELMAVIEAMRALKKPGTPIVIHADSQYVINAIEKKWVFGWEKKGFKKKKNPDLWKQFLEQYRKHDVKFEWVKGHAGIEENERCDELAKEAAENPTETDEGYVNG